MIPTLSVQELAQMKQKNEAFTWENLPELGIDDPAAPSMFS